MVRQRGRPHSGRRRSEAARQAILDATFALFHETPESGVTIDAIAKAAGVGRQTIYRWWPSKGAVIAEALSERARAVARTPDTGDLRTDLVEFLAATFASVADPANGRMLRRLMTAAQEDAHLAAAVADFTERRRHELRVILERGRQRGQVAATADLDALIDLAYGFLWYRLLVGHAALDARAAEILADALLAADGGRVATRTGETAPPDQTAGNIAAERERR